MFTIENVVPWGRSMDEYAAMFSLSSRELGSRILGCGDGPACFNAEMTARGHSVTSVDPLYRFSAEEIRQRIDKTYSTVLEQLRDNRDDYVWTGVSSPSALGEIRLQAMNMFLEDFPDGKVAGRYLTGELPFLPFKNRIFDLALCSHLLFLYSEQLSTDFHCRAIREMLRVAREIRIFPLLTLGGAPSPHLESVWGRLRGAGRACEIESVDYEFQRGGNQMLKVK